MMRAPEEWYVFWWSGLTTRETTVGAVLRFASKRVGEEESHAKWERCSIGNWERNRVQPNH